MKVYSVPEFNSVVLVLMVAFRNAAKRANKLDLLPCINQMQEWRTSQLPQIAEDEEPAGQWPPPLPSLSTHLIVAWKQLHRAKVWLDYPMVVNETISAKEAELLALLATPVPKKASSFVKREEAIKSIESSIAAFKRQRKTLAGDRTAWAIKSNVVDILEYIIYEVNKLGR